MTTASLALTRPARRTRAIQVRVRGCVQGVGFRPHVWRLASELNISGDVSNDSEGVLIHAAGEETAIREFLHRLETNAPILAKIEAIESRDFAGRIAQGFTISPSAKGPVRTQIAPDAATCAECAAEIRDPFARRYRYPFANCTQCGPRLSIIDAIPYDRARTAMASFALCADCADEYADPADRRFHAEAIACHACGPKARLVRFDGRAVSFERYSQLDDADAAGGLILNGYIVAIKGLGGYQLACDAANAEAVARLRREKFRAAKPFALMARDIGVIRQYAAPSEVEVAALTSPQSPIVILDASGPAFLPEAVAPGLGTLGFMLPTTPLHDLLLKRVSRPVVMTSGNRSDRPQLIDDAAAAQELANIADFALVHDRPIRNRVDDSVVRMIGGSLRMLRRSRGYAPNPFPMPRGFETSPRISAYGAELKSTFCAISPDHAVLSQHIGDLDDPDTYQDYERAIELYSRLYEHGPDAIAVDMHPEYRSTKLGCRHAAEMNLPIVEVQHHHAHVAACLAENRRPLGSRPVLGIVLDGLGLGHNGEFWGGEFLLADYARARRVGTFKPVAMLGGEQAMREPWRNLYAHLMSAMSWDEFALNFSELEVFADLAARPRAIIDQMLGASIQAAPASSCGRLFDAVAAALGVSRDRQAYEGEAASRLESIVDRSALRDESEALAYLFAIPNLKSNGLPYIEPRAMWRALLGDLILKTPPPIIAARFHRGLARSLAAMAKKLSGDCRDAFPAIVLSGGCFQNRILFEETERCLCASGFSVLSHRQVPPNDGGIALGQAMVAAAQMIQMGKS